MEAHEAQQPSRQASPASQQQQEGAEWPSNLSWLSHSSLSSSTTSSDLSDPDIAVDLLRQSVARAQEDKSDVSHHSHHHKVLPGM